MMNRRTYLAFHFENDLWRVNQIRAELEAPRSSQAGFLDEAEYGAALHQDKDTIRRLIRERVAGTSVTLVLIGSETASRPFVHLQIEASIANKNGFLGIHVHAIDDESGEPSASGPPPLLPAEIAFPCYVWDWDFERLQQEIEAAGQRSDRWRAQRPLGTSA
jgi:MTH538 TIR-like domain (DUF1863)